MKVQIKNNIYYIGFKHENNCDKEDCRSYTHCSIKKEGVETPIGTGIAQLSLKDTYDKEKGRKITLGRALANAGFTKEEKTVFWEQYRTSSPKPRWGN